MKRTLARIIESAFDLDEFKEALEAEVAERIDYSSIAASVLDRYEDEFASSCVDAAEEYISCL